MRTLMIGVLFAILGVMTATAQGMNETRGPQGEQPVNFGVGVIGMYPSDRTKIKDMKLKAAILMHTDSDFTNAVIAGARQRFDQLGITVAYSGNAKFDAAKQTADIEAALALDVNIIVILVLDPAKGAAALKKAVAQGVRIALLSNLPDGFVHGKDYAALVTDDLFSMGKSVAEMMGESLKGTGEVMWLYHDAKYYVTNQRDMAVKNSLRTLYPSIRIIAEKGIANPDDTQKIMADLLAKNPRVDAVYAPWDAIADRVIAAARAAGRSDLKVFTMDLGKNVSLDMAKNGMTAGIVVDLPYTIGECLAVLGATSVLGNKTPAFVVVPAVKVTRNNLAQMWQRAYRIDPPKEVIDALNTRLGGRSCIATSDGCRH